MYLYYLVLMYLPAMRITQWQQRGGRSVVARPQMGMQERNWASLTSVGVVCVCGWLVVSRPLLPQDALATLLAI